MLCLLLLLVACGADSPSEPDDAVDDAPVEASDTPEASADAPVGAIGGEPILPQPVVVGGISAEDVEAGVAEQMAGITGCYESQRAEEPGLSGKVLVHFTIAVDGKVERTSIRSSSLRHPPTESCVEQVVAGARFPALQTGRIAIVDYPFLFPSP